MQNILSGICFLRHYAYGGAIHFVLTIYMCVLVHMYGVQYKQQQYLSHKSPGIGERAHHGPHPSGAAAWNGTPVARMDKNGRARVSCRPV
jgi:hypothetical protein